MAPKKNENKTAIVPKKPKERKGRIKKDSQKAKKKEIIKVKLPLKIPKNDTKKKPVVEDMLTLTFDRMNEVARAQLVKDCPVEIESTPEPVTKRRGRKQKIQDPGPDTVPKKKPKIPEKVQKKVLKKPRVARSKQNAAVRKRGRQPVRGKPKPADDSATTSPSILSQSAAAYKTPMKHLQKPTVQTNSDSRRTSLTSEWSWAKDVSGSSTTTCVTVGSASCTDIVCLDGKLPELKLEKITIPDHTPKNETQETMCEKQENEHSLSEDSSSSCSSSSSSSSSYSSTTRNSLNLSTSSISPISHSPTYTAVNQSFDRSKKWDPNKVDPTIAMLKPKLISFDLSFPVLHNVSEHILDMKFEEKVFKILKEENNAIMGCNLLNQLLSEKCSIAENETPETEENKDQIMEEPEFAIPDVTAVSNKSFCDYRDSHNDYSLRRETDDPNDDDDALSLFAESLTGMDSSRLSGAASVPAAPPTHEEYVPQALAKRPVKVAYQPTKIIEPENTNTKTKPVCEKQNADSTSIQGTAKEEWKELLEAVKVPPPNSILPRPQQSARNVNGNNPQPLTLFSYRPPHGATNLTLWGVCFFNLAAKCKKNVCRYPHRIIGDTEMSKRLSRLSEEQFLQEYMLFTKWPPLKRRYIKCYIDECQRRELPQILVEIVVHFLSNIHPSSAMDSNITVDIVESTLMYLNSWDLEVCEHLLTYSVQGKLLCDVFMEVIGNTQNFSRFKNVFISLADFMVRINRTFNLDVVAHVLERVCILPYEAPLSAVLVAIIEKTDSRIFNYNMMENFAAQLSSFNKGLYERLLVIKERNVTVEEPVGVSEVPPALPSPCGSQELPPVIQNGGTDEQTSYTSPDTTNVDNGNKPASDPVFIRTINHLVKPPDLSKPPPSRPRSMYSSWNYRSILQQIPRGPLMRPKKMPMGPLQRPQFKYPRRHGPEFYGHY